VNGEELQKLGIKRYLSIAGILVDSVKEIGLFIVVRSEDNVVDDSLQALERLAGGFDRAGVTLLGGA
jgi:hypothetical protein